MLSKLVFAIVILIFLMLYFWLYLIPAAYVKSSLDGKTYMVRDTPDKQISADTLAQIRQNIKILTDHMLANAPPQYKHNITELDKKMKHVVITENISDFYYTSYSVNKGERLVFCMKSRKKDKHKHDINLMMYVVLHEISHIACPKYGHGDEFKKVFKFIVQNAVQLGLYVPIDFKTNPTEYCGMTISDSIV